MAVFLPEEALFLEYSPLQYVLQGSSRFISLITDYRLVQRSGSADRDEEEQRYHTSDHFRRDHGTDQRLLWHIEG